MRKLLGGNLPVGLFPATTYHEFDVSLSNGCAIVVYTDGVTDALNAEEEPFGDERLLRCCQSLPKGAGGKAIDSMILEKVSEWAAGVEQFDDTTVVVLSLDQHE